MRARHTRWTRALGGPGAPAPRAPESVDAADVDADELERRVFGVDATDELAAAHAGDDDPPAASGVS
jgi:hypothetical protein